MVRQLFHKECDGGSIPPQTTKHYAVIAQLIERILGTDEAGGLIPPNGTNFAGTELTGVAVGLPPRSERRRVRFPVSAPIHRRAALPY